MKCVPKQFGRLYPASPSEQTCTVESLVQEAEGLGRFLLRFRLILVEQLYPGIYGVFLC